jgi:hypothetical protein
MRIDSEFIWLTWSNIRIKPLINKLKIEEKQPGKFANLPIVSANGWASQNPASMKFR